MDRRRVPWARREATGTAQARATVRGVFLLQVLANGLGIAVVVAYLRLLFPRAEAEQSELNLAVFGVYLVALLVVALPLNMVALRRAVIWVRQGRTPTDRQRGLLFRLPLLETMSAFVTWAAGAVLFGIVNADARRAAIGIFLAGIVVCTLLFLLLEAHFRPVFALALVDADLPEGRREVFPRLVLAWLLGSAIPLAALGASRFLGPVATEAERLPWLAGAGILGGFLVTAVAAVSVSRPLNRVRDALRQVERGDLEVHVPVDDLGELGRLAEGVNDLVAGLRERDQLRDLFSRQVGQAHLAEMASGGAVDRPGEARTVTVLFVDLRGYVGYTRRLPPAAVVEMLNRFFRVVVAVVNREGGWVNKFEGDAALCLFGAPQDQADHAARGLRAADAIPRELAHLEDEVLPAGIGVATGEVIAGFVGTAERYEYTVIGDVVNVASRLCDAAKVTPGGVLAEAATVEAAGCPDHWRPAGSRRIRGLDGRVRVFAPRPLRRRGRAR